MPLRKRKTRFVDFVMTMFKPVVQAYNWFLTYRDTTHYNLAITSQIIYLEKLLNDKFANGSPARDVSVNLGLYDGSPIGIYITEPDLAIYPNYVWNKVEQRPKTYLYNKWNVATAYLVGDKVVYGTNVYRCIANHTGSLPTDATKWELSGSRFFLRNTSEFDGEYDFIVNIPNAVGDVTDPLFAAQVSATINIYRIAGKRFQLVNY